ncbi:MAG: hypothetical protein HY578_07440 [Nitrospinae bacterium]|nr:hypothetical protein [Nitrospinota bacterium]
MVQIDIPAAFVVSMFSIDLGRNILKAEAEKTYGGRPSIYYRYLFRSVFFAGFVIAPAGIYLLSGWPGWEQIYWSRRPELVMHTGWVNALIPTFFIMAIMLGAYLGHVLGYQWLISGRANYLRPTYIGVVIVVTIIVVINYPSFLLVGTYDQYHNLNGQARTDMTSVWSNPYGFSIAWLGVMIYFVIASAYLIRTILRESASYSKG